MRLVTLPTFRRRAAAGFALVLTTASAGAAQERFRLALDPDAALSDLAGIPAAALDSLLGADARRLGGLLVVQDTKDRPGEARSRSGVGVVLVSRDAGPTLHEVAVAWPPGEAASDLESACHIPGTATEFLVAESGYYPPDSDEPRYGRLFRLRLEREGNGWHGRIVEATRLPEGTVDLEGMACAAQGDEVLVILGERGGGEPGIDGRLHWTFLRRGTFPERITLRGRPFDSNPALELPRDISGLYLDANGLLWVTSAEDPGDEGPFRSAVQLAGTVRFGRADPITLFPVAIPVYVDPSRKIEGVGPGVLPWVPLSVVTEDEALGGTWFPLILR